ncbi:MULTISPECIES: phage tail tube protein [Pseudomonas]|uniref:phage tail tube protein n=1 Tax=Pseudomonas TaxID=286 RepID=UPI0025962EF4|nr:MULTISPECIES: phage tail tube protein [Pseudomonas]
MAILAQGSQVYFIDPDTKAVVPVECATAFTPGGAPADQIETTCLEDTTRSYMPGLRTPGTASLTVNFDPANESHVRMYELSQRDPSPTMNWALGWSDGTEAPTADTDGDFALPTSRTFYTFQGYMSDVPFDFAANTVVTSAATIQRTGPGVLARKVTTP